MIGIMEVGSFPSVYVGLGVGAIAGLFVSCLLFRFALIVSSAVVFAAVGLLGASIYLDQKSPGAIDPPARLLLGSGERPASASPESADPSTSFLVTRSQELQRIYLTVCRMASLTSRVF
jgi:hypothetical protein